MTESEKYPEGYSAKYQKAKREMEVNHFFFFLALILTAVYVINSQLFPNESAFPAILILVYGYAVFVIFVFWKYRKNKESTLQKIKE